MLEEPPKTDPREDPWKRWTFYYVMAIQSTIPILGGALAGMWVDRTWGSSPWGLFSLLFLGLGASIVNLFRIARRFRSES